MYVLGISHNESEVLSMAEVILTVDNFEDEVIKSDKPVLVDFWATWCGPCKMQAPILEEFSSKHDEIKVAKVNVDDEAELAEQYKIMSIPTLAYFENGELVKKEAGLKKLEDLEIYTNRV